MAYIPTFSKTERGKGLQRVVRRAARKAGLHDHELARIMTFFFEELAHEVSKGNPVEIPGIGLFVAYWRRKRNKERSKHVQPRFYSSRCWNAQVAASAPLSAKGEQNAFRYLRNHRDVQTKSAAASRNRTFTALARYRSWLRADGRRNGIDLPKDD